MLRRKSPSWGLALLPIVVLALILAPVSVFAQSKTIDGVTLVAPDNQSECPPDNQIIISGVGVGVGVRYDFFDATTSTFVHLGGGTVISTGVDIYLAFPYPAAVDGRTFAVFIDTTGASGARVVIGSKWLVDCPAATATPTDTFTPTPSDTPTATPTDTPTPTATDTPTNTPTPTVTDTPTNTPTEPATDTPTATPALFGCTPGFWKVDQHFDSWVGYSPSDDFESVFGVDASFDPHTLLDASWLQGGGEFALARHAVAALLNSTSPDVDYPYSTAQVIAMVQNAYATGDFESAKNLLAWGNELGCPLD
ncbi:MAG TPA: hypothetical protein VFI11_05675 [Anaerolineales bacterium]|nr:hypothetical protein [Anaerolineales bacterium]